MENYQCLNGTKKGERMAIKIKVSYEHEQELNKIIVMLGPIIKDIKPSNFN